MAIRTSIARHFAIRLIIITIVMLVLGVWGVYDYVIAIPAQQKAFERYQAMSLTQQALQPDLSGEERRETVEEALAAIEHEIKDVLEKHTARAGVQRDVVEGEEGREMLREMSDESERADAAQAGTEAGEKLLASMRETSELDWFSALLVFEQALRQPRGIDGELTAFQRDVYQTTEQQMSQIARDEAPTPPSTFDHVVQLLYISLLLCVPYFLWVYVATMRRVYELEEDGTLRTPVGTWSADEIADIDMSRWMAKSTAQVVHKDSQRITLDDYKHRNMHLIVGALAHQFYPDQWTEDAKPVKAEEEADEDDEAIRDEQQAVDEALEGEERT